VGGDQFGMDTGESSSGGETTTSTTSTTTESSTGGESTGGESTSTSSSSSGVDESSTGPADACGDGRVAPGELCLDPDPVLFAMGAGARDIALADFDLDQHLDVATLDTVALTVSLRHGDGMGGFGEPESWPVTVEAFRMRAADCDLDGNPELVVAGENLTVFHNDAGTLTPAETISAGLFTSETSDAVLAPFDAFLGLDIVHSGTTSTYFQRGELGGAGWTFGTEVQLGVEGDEGAGLAAVPFTFDDDEIADIVYMNRNFEHADLLTANGQGGFQHHSDVQVCPTGSGGYNIAVGDLDGDGDEDLVATCDNDQWTVTLGNGDGTFEDSTFQGLMGGFRPDIVDVDQDDDADVVLSAVPQGRIVVFQNDGAAALQVAPPLQSQGLTWSFAVGDVDEDGAVDIATAYGTDTDGSVALFLSDP
jgi:hypothetical protein